MGFSPSIRTPIGLWFDTSSTLAAKEGLRSITVRPSLLKGKGQGPAKWHSALEVMQARKYVEQWGEHILSYVDLPDSESAGAIAEEVFD